MTRKDYDALWHDLYNAHWNIYKNPDAAFKFACARMQKLHGERPEELAPPLTAKAGALWFGVPMQMLNGIWKWFDGKKLVFGAVLDILSSVAIALPAILPAVGVEAALTTQIVAKAIMVVGLAHKAYRYIYKEEHKDNA